MIMLIVAPASEWVISMPHDDDWNTLVSFLPPDWEELAVSLGAVKRLRGFGSAEDLLRVLLIHLAEGCSLRETALRAKRAGIADVSDVALLKRLRNAEPWLHALCGGVCASAIATEPLGKIGRRLVAIDATCVSEPGSTGTDWRLHYALELPSLSCLHFELTDEKGAELLERFPVRANDLILGDRAYCRLPGIEHARSHGADVLVRMKLSQRNIYRIEVPSEHFDFLSAAEDMKEDELREWDILLGGVGQKRLPGRLSLLRRSEETAERERARIRREAKKKKRLVREETLRSAAYVGLFTTLPRETCSAEDLFRIYRFRWQVEIAFKRLKSVSHFGHLPKHDPASCRSWLYGKLLVGLLAEKMSQTAFFP